jgi:hypothetical protein
VANVRLEATTWAELQVMIEVKGSHFKRKAIPSGVRCYGQPQEVFEERDTRNGTPGSATPGAIGPRSNMCRRWTSIRECPSTEWALDGERMEPLRVSRAPRKHLYRAVDRVGAGVDFRLCPEAFQIEHRSRQPVASNGLHPTWL